MIEDGYGIEEEGVQMRNTTACLYAGRHDPLEEGKFVRREKVAEVSLVKKDKI